MLRCPSFLQLIGRLGAGRIIKMGKVNYDLIELLISGGAVTFVNQARLVSWVRWRIRYRTSKKEQVKEYEWQYPAKVRSSMAARGLDFSMLRYQDKKKGTARVDKTEKSDGKKPTNLISKWMEIPASEMHSGRLRLYYRKTRELPSVSFQSYRLPRGVQIYRHRQMTPP